ncbi:hypothetical protein HOP50_03g24920 [Chloropicon primus]|uniref:Uncharacterized protein n=2 Tax=Chloropicon primus TaxID=1764295 RepID=A0A5B8MIR7_9CHLO|nr:hypothetical protein A3770_03p24920 [Chloropicon primus]UPQ99185.1 hypothetical protein HOP50_03g24920 [Chloropicon primus]|eukprot:QDZ19974.1 hypothetical protein A3770_03p24920 [Chloropicon primus]
MEKSVSERVKEGMMSSIVTSSVAGVEVVPGRDEVKLLLEAIDATRHAARLWAQLVGPYLTWVYRVARRSLTQGFLYSRKKFKDLDEDTQRSIFASIVVVVGLLVAKRLIERSKVFAKLRKAYDQQAAKARLAWRKFSKRIEKTSKVLADLLPHLVLVSLFGLYLGLMPHSVRNTLEGPVIYFVLGKLYPAVWSAEALVTGSDRLEKFLQLWTSFYVLEVIGEVPLLVPFLSPLLRYVANDALAAARFFLALWIALPFTNGAALLCSALSPQEAISSGGKATAKKRGELTGWFLETANRLGVIRVPNAIKSVATDLVTHWVHLLTLPFLFTPGFITYYGGVMSGKMFPIRASLRAQVGGDQKEEVVHWTTYWVVFSNLDCAHHLVSMVVGWIPFWQHLKIAGIFWLQFPYFRGATVLFSSLNPAMVERSCSYLTGKNLKLKLSLKGKATKTKAKAKGEKEKKED